MHPLLLDLKHSHPRGFTQNKSARISELETELLEAQRMITVHTSSEGDGNSGHGSDSESLPSEPDGEGALNTTQPVVNQQYVASTPYTPFAVPPAASAFTPASSDSREHYGGNVQQSTQYFSSGSVGEVGRGEADIRASEREVEILKLLLVEQEQQVSVIFIFAAMVMQYFFCGSDQSMLDRYFSCQRLRLRGSTYSS